MASAAEQAKAMMEARAAIRERDEARAELELAKAGIAAALGVPADLSWEELQGSIVATVEAKGGAT